MTLPALRATTGDVIVPGQGLVRVVGQPHPLRAARVVRDVPAGLTVAEIVEEVFPDRAGRPLALYLVSDGDEWSLPEERWRRVRPKPGTTVAFRAMLHGKSAFGIGVALAAIAAAIAVPILLPAGLALGSLTIGAATLGSIAAAGVAVAGSLLGNVLFPVRPAQLAPAAEQAKLPVPSTVASLGSVSGGAGAQDVRRTVYSIAGGRNQARAYGSIPVTLGAHRMSPPYAAAPYTEIVGEDQYLRLLFCWGYGPLAISDLRIGQTPITAFADCEVETRYGYPTDTPIGLYPTQASQEDLQIDLRAGVQNIRTTADDGDSISIDVTAPNGVFQFDRATGEYLPNPFHVGVWARLQPSGAYEKIGTVYFYLERETSRRGFYWKPPVRGQYDIMLIKESGDFGDPETYRERVYWTALRTFTHGYPVQFDKPLAMTAFRIRASEQLSGVIDTFNGRVSSIAARIDGGVAETNRCPDLFRLVLQGAANKRPVPNSQIDLQNLREWNAFCASRGYAYNQVRENATSVYDTLADIAAAGRAVPTFRDGKWGVIWDDPAALVVQHFTPRNSSNFSAQRSYRRLPHGLRVRFLNEQKDYAQDERIVYDDGYDETNATLFEGIEFPGVTDPDLIWQHGRYHIAQARLRPETYTLTAAFEHLRCTRGDRVRVTHDVPLWGQIGARVKEVVGQLVTLDEIVTMEPDKSYAVRFRRKDGSSLLRNVEPFVGETRAITLALDTGPGPAVLVVPDVGDLAMFGESGKESVVLRVLGIAHQGDLAAVLTLVDDAPEIIDADTGDIPPFDSRISEPVDPFSFPPTDLVVQEIVEGSGGGKTATVRLSWKSRVGRVREFEAQATDDASGEWRLRQVVQPPQTSADFRGIYLGVFSFRVRAHFEDGSVSAWSTLPANRVTGVHLSTPLAAVTNLRTSYLDGIENLTWDEIRDFREVFYEIRMGDAWASALVLGKVAHPPFAVPGNGTFWVSAISHPLTALTVYSETPVSVSIQGARLVKNVIASFNERSEGWTGQRVDLAIVSGSLQTALGGSGVYYSPHTVDVGRIAPCPITIAWKATGARAGQSFLDVPDFLAETDFLGAEAAAFIDAYPEIRIGSVNDAYSVDDIYASPDVYNDLIDWAGWRKFTPGTYVGRYFEFRLRLQSFDQAVTAIGLEFSFIVDMPDRIDHVVNLALPPAGQAIVFQPDGASGPSAFNGGPNNSPVPYVNATILNGQTGDVLEVASLTPEGVTLRVTNGGSGVARTVNADFQGY